MKLIKTKAEKAMEAKLAIRQGINELKKCDRSLEKKKEEMIRFAQEAKQQGITQQYDVAVNGLKMVLAYQKRCRAMILQIQMTETMRDLTTMSSKFVKLMGDVGKEVSKVTQSTKFLKNQVAFEKGVLASEAAMDQLEGFLEDSGMAFETDTEADVDEEIRNMIDATGSAGSSAIDQEIEKKLAELEKKRAALKE